MRKKKRKVRDHNLFPPHMLPQVPELVFPYRLYEKISCTSQHAFVNYTDRVIRRHHCMIKERCLNPSLSNHIGRNIRRAKQGSAYLNALITGIFLQISCSIIKVRRAYPEIDGNSTSVRIRSMFSARAFNTSHAFKPSDTAATASKKEEVLSM